jgi:hypothetical protein
MALHPNPLSKVFLTGVVETRPDHDAWRSQYIGTSLLPFREVPGYKLAWDVISSENNLAGLFAINGRPVPGSEMMFEGVFQEVMNIMSSRVIHPEDVMLLREPGEPAVGTMTYDMKTKAQRKVRDNIAACDDEVDAQVEYLIMQALQGSITWPPRDADGNAITTKMPQWGNLDVVINFPLRAAFNQKASTLTGHNSRAGTQVVWTTEATSNPIKDLEVIAQHIVNTIGIDAHGSTIIMSSNLMSYLAFNATIVSWVKGTESGIKMISVPELQDFIKTRIGYEIKLYGARWTYRSSVESESGPTINSVPFMGDNTLFIIPPGVKIGYFAVAPSPDGEYKKGKYTWMVQDKEPPWETRVGEGLVGFPILERADQIYIFDAGS